MTSPIDTCEECGGLTRILNVRNRIKYRARRRECRDCGHRFSTYETRTKPTDEPPRSVKELENIQYELAITQQRISDLLSQQP